jgi:hypothetical protein
LFANVWLTVVEKFAWNMGVPSLKYHLYVTAPGSVVKLVKVTFEPVQEDVGDTLKSMVCAKPGEPNTVKTKPMHTPFDVLLKMD